MTIPPRADHCADSVDADGLRVEATVERGEFRLDVRLRARAGEVLGVLGPNGSGKTTLLRAIAGLTPLTAGRIRLDDEPLDDPAAGVFTPPERRRVGVVFQNYRLFPHLSVRDNVGFALRNLGASRSVARAEAQRWLDRLGIAALAGRRPAQLSGGQAQRVALARALAADPGVLLLDEPLAALDTRTKLEVRGELRRHLADFPGPTLLVTHDPLEAMVMTDRLLVIEDGRVTQEGTPAEVARRPVTPYVARLMGLNLYSGERRSARGVDLSDGARMTVVTEGLVDEPVLVAIRPTAIGMHLERPDRLSARNVWPGVVDGLELLADRIRVQVQGHPAALVDVTADAVAELTLVPGTPVWLSAKATEVDAWPDPGRVS